MSELNERVSRFVYVGIRRTSSGFGGATCGWMLLPRASSSWSSSFLPRICGGRGGRFFLVCMEGAGVYGGGPLLHDCVHDFRRLFLFFFSPSFPRSLLGGSPSRQADRRQEARACAPFILRVGERFISDREVKIWTLHLAADGCHCGRNAYPEAARDCHLERRRLGGWGLGGGGRGGCHADRLLPGLLSHVKHIKVTDMLFFRSAIGPGC